jgi:hypothetical protein
VNNALVILSLKSLPRVYRKAAVCLLSVPVVFAGAAQARDAEAAKAAYVLLDGMN